MTLTPEIMPIPVNKPRLILFVAFPGMCMLDMAGPQTVFWCADQRMAERGLARYVRHTVSIDGGLVQTLEGVPFETRPVADFDLDDIDTIVVPGGPDIQSALARLDKLVAWLGEAAGKARRTASVCSGAFMLAKAGLLDGKRAATHWAMCDQLKESHPSVHIDRDAIFIQQDKVWTSAGVTAGIDLALALVEGDCGHQVTLAVARELVVFLKRPGGQSQFSSLLQAQTEDVEVFDELHLWITEHLGNEDLSVEVLAARASMSPRNFSRVYKERTGRTPAKAVELFRLEAARRLLEGSDRNIDQVARQCGFGDEERMRVTFQRNLGVSPKEYRMRFSVGA
jgi:transcriptional regulator GlxA family with amidase domain